MFATSLYRVGRYNAMFQTDKYDTPHLLPFKKSHHPDAAAPSSAKAFNETLIAGLRSLLPVPSPFVPLAWLRLAVDSLSRILSEASALIADPSLPAPDRSALASHLDASVALLDACNAISALLDRLLRRRLLLRYALRLLSSPNPDTISRARDAIRERDESPELAVRPTAGDLIRKLHPADPPRGKSSAVRKAIYAVEAVSSLVASAVLAVLGGADKADLAGIRVSGEFPWAEAFNEVAIAVAGRIPGSAAEVGAAEARARVLAAVMDGEDDGEKAERLRSVVEVAEKATDELTEGLERLSNAVNGLFRVGLSTRNTALQSFRIVPHKCK